MPKMGIETVLMLIAPAIQFAWQKLNRLAKASKNISPP
jgi:hypothetical protein